MEKGRKREGKGKKNELRYIVFFHQFEWIYVLLIRVLHVFEHTFLDFVERGRPGGKLGS